MAVKYLDVSVLIGITGRLHDHLAAYVIHTVLHIYIYLQLYIQ